MLQTTTLDNGLVVLAKKDGSPLTYGNRAQAVTKAQSDDVQRAYPGRAWIERTSEKTRFYVVVEPSLEEIDLNYLAPAYDGPDGEEPDLYDRLSSADADYHYSNDTDFLEPEEFGEEEYAQLAAIDDLKEVAIYDTAIDLADKIAEIGFGTKEEFSEAINEVVGEQLDAIAHPLAEYIRSCHSALIPSAKSRNNAAIHARHERLNREARRILDRLPPFLPDYIKHVPRAGRPCGVYLGFDRCATTPHLEVSPHDIKTLTECGVLNYRRKRKQYRFDEAKVKEVIGI